MIDTTPATGQQRLQTLSDLFRDVMQVAYVTDDLEKATAYFEKTLGTTRCQTTFKANLGGIVYVDDELTEEWVIDVALVNAGPTNLEIIRPVSGAVDIYRDYIRPDSLCTFHHLGCRIPSFDAATKVVESAGKSWKQYGNVGGQIKFGYVDMTAELGHYVEVMDLGPAAAERFAALEAESNA